MEVQQELQYNKHLPDVFEAWHKIVVQYCLRFNHTNLQLCHHHDQHDVVCSMHYIKK